MTETAVATGAYNLLRHCANARPGQRLLIAYEPAQYEHFDSDVVDCVAAEAERLGLSDDLVLSVDLVDVGFDARDPDLSPGLLKRMEVADIVVFLARLGDQLGSPKCRAGR